jgi:hypothetical protein
MEPPAYSFSDLIKLVQVINSDIEAFCGRHHMPAPDPISGACNHWAGNTIYHQHYQFFRLSHVPILAAGQLATPVVEHQDVGVYEVSREWPARAFVVRAQKPGRDDQVREVANRIAREWRLLSEGEDKGYGNGISIKVNTQNTFVTQTRDGLVAVFIPRHRSRLSTRTATPRKTDAGVLEMLGYFVIDVLDEYMDAAERSPEQRTELARSWLTDLAPEQDTIDKFIDNIKICLDDAVSSYEASIDKLWSSPDADPVEEPRAAAARLASEIQHDKELNDGQRGHLYRELLAAVLDAGSAGR